MTCPTSAFDICSTNFRINNSWRSSGRRRMAANSQGVTHYMGRVLGEMDLRPTPIDTQGFKILLSVIEQTCNDPWQLFVDLQRYNPFTAAMRARLHDSLARIMGTLEEGSLDTGKERKSQ